MLIVLCPGQGAQTAECLSPWMDLPGVAQFISGLEEASGVDLINIGTRPDADVLATANGQPLLVAVGLASAFALGPLPPAALLLGHSAGEITASAVAGVFSYEEAVRLAAARGAAMARACEQQDSSLIVVANRGTESSIERAAARYDCWIAGINGDGQVLVGGLTTAIDAFVRTLKPGTPMRRLALSGAFHTPLMQSAAIQWGEDVAVSVNRTMTHGIVSNLDGAVVHRADEVPGRLMRQVTEPLRMDRCFETLRHLGATTAVELAPGQPLSTLVKSNLPECTSVVAVRTPADLPAARAAITLEADS